MASWIPKKASSILDLVEACAILALQFWGYLIVSGYRHVPCDVPKADVALRALKRWPVAKAPKAPQRPTRCAEPPYLDVRKLKKQGETIQETSPFSKRLSPRVMCLMCLMCLDFFLEMLGKFPPWNSCFMSVFLKALDSTVSWHVVSGILWPKLSGNRRMIERHPKTPTTNLPAFPPL